VLFRMSGDGQSNKTGNPVKVSCRYRESNLEPTVIVAIAESPEVRFGVTSGWSRCSGRAARGVGGVSGVWRQMLWSTSSAPLVAQGLSDRRPARHRLKRPLEFPKVNAVEPSQSGKNAVHFMSEYVNWLWTG
jgi:hypothetical protein